MTLCVGEQEVILEKNGNKVIVQLENDTKLCTLLKMTFHEILACLKVTISLPRINEINGVMLCQNILNVIVKRIRNKSFSFDHPSY